MLDLHRGGEAARDQIVQPTVFSWMQSPSARALIHSISGFAPSRSHRSLRRWTRSWNGVSPHVRERARLERGDKVVYLDIRVEHVIDLLGRGEAARDQIVERAVFSEFIPPVHVR